MRQGFGGTWSLISKEEPRGVTHTDKYLEGPILQSQVRPGFELFLKQQSCHKRVTPLLETEDTN